ncbi:hypothetical protein [Xanthomonas campestris]|uniref:hypothetical protein n=1 Tax=Xanthomonas campestris TaxID=339 RepID=UPI0015F26509|nr:hypothetical protein [Xanthomonas campestris]MEA9845157.1 hypothetical protein [Xanthomonas campestris pv. raphani]MEA9975408.1 hypothetical protein [Xanthomonas campestris pv. raphani]
MFLYWRNGEQRFPRGLLGLAFDGCLVALLPEAEADIYLPAGQKPSIFGPAVFSQDQLAQGNDAPKRQRGRGLAESGTGMYRGGESDRMSAEPKS